MKKQEMKKAKIEIIEALKGKSKAEFLADDYIEAEKKLLKELEKLKMFGDKCSCDETTGINTIHEGNFPEITSYCLECGGYINDKV